MNDINYYSAGDKGLIIDFGNQISIDMNERIRALAHKINIDKINGVIELIPTYTTILIIYDPIVIRFNRLINIIDKINSELDETETHNGIVYHIPTAYGGRFGDDIEFVANYNNLNVNEVIDIHTKNNYIIYMIGFTPGFPYLGGMSLKLSTPRISVPRERIPAGSVGIAGEQTGVYPIDSPGGWQLIGRTPIKLFDAFREEPVLFKAGDFIRFESITEHDYDLIQRDVKRETFKIDTSRLKGGAQLG